MKAWWTFMKAWWTLAPGQKGAKKFLERYVARPTCIICGGQQLQPFLHLSEKGVPHNIPAHDVIYSYRAMTVCRNCEHGQIEVYSHDCWAYYGDEDWEMYWWYALSPSDVRRLRSLLNSCPNCLNPTCDCSIHSSLRGSTKFLWSGVRHAYSPWEKTGFAWLTLEENDKKVMFKIDEQKCIGQAA